jgi:tRNA A-37 threonylcarbamoyl transferase component Bud32
MEINAGPRVFATQHEMCEEFLDGARPKLHPSELGALHGRLLQRLHSKDIIYLDHFARHRRWKDGDVRLIDFGISIVYDGSEDIPVDRLFYVSGIMEGMDPEDLPKLGKYYPERYVRVDPGQLKIKEARRMAEQITMLMIRPSYTVEGARVTSDAYVGLVKEGFWKGYGESLSINISVN